MASALISGLVGAQNPPRSIRVSDPSAEARQRLQSTFGAECFERSEDAVRDADLIVLAVKPQVMPAVLAELGDCVQGDPLLLSIAAGITVETLRAAFEPPPPVVRAMPNTPALIGRGISGAFAGPGCGPQQRALAESVLTAAGECVWIEDEALMDVVTAVSGSGPAYFFLLIEAMRDAGQALGLSADTANQLALHTAAGAGAMAIDSNVDVAELRRRVTSPGGTTQAALEAFRDGGFEALVSKAVTAATRRGQALARKEPSA
ncbi:MAG: pyrroline-5-carboxylate reductase [Xanthomonadales bacterium]|nr:pyrroline-5-carboxylate reductase [Xanthomonadales bacterium]